MVSRRLPVAVLTLLLTALQAQAQVDELERAFKEQDLQTLLDRALELNIIARVLPPDEAPPWNSASHQITVPGRSVAVRLVGEKIRVDAVFTPVEQEDGRLLLVAQGQVWLGGAAETQYLTTFQSIPVDMGEKVLFFPLGYSGEVAKPRTFTLQIEVEIYPYRQAAPRLPPPDDTHNFIP